MIQTKHPITKPQTNTIHILGNGSSLDLFNRNEWPDDHWFVGCNFSNPELKPDFTVIMDAKPIMKFYEGYKLQIPLVISDRGVKYIEQDKGGWNKLLSDSFILVDVIDMIHDKGRKFPMNSGQHATVYAIQKNLPLVKTVYLWGINSFWQDDIVSKTDEIIKRNKQTKTNKNVSACWRMYWNDIFEKYNDVEFIIKGMPNENVA